MSKTLTACFYPILGCLKAAEQFLGAGRIWRPVTPKQAEFIKMVTSAFPDADNIKELTRIASRSADEINAWLAKHGFNNIKLDPFDSRTFGTASILDVAVKWLHPGTESTLNTRDGGSFSAAEMKTCEVFTSPTTTERVVRFTTETGERMYLVMGDAPASELKLMESVIECRKNLTPYRRTVEKAVFPLVELDRQEDISWLVNLETTTELGLGYYISQALQQTKFHMDQFGARVQSAAALACRSLSLKETIVINRPFYVWLERDGLSLPLFAAYLDTDVWTPVTR